MPHISFIARCTCLSCLCPATGFSQTASVGLTFLRTDMCPSPWTYAAAQPRFPWPQSWVSVPAAQTEKIGSPKLCFSHQTKLTSVKSGSSTVQEYQFWSKRSGFESWLSKWGILAKLLYLNLLNLNFLISIIKIAIIVSQDCCEQHMKILV